VDDLKFPAALSFPKGYRLTAEIKQEKIYSRKTAIPLAPGTKNGGSQFPIVTFFDLNLM
jgi:hypothetical protein